MLALRIVVVLMAFAVHSACVDPDRVLRLLRPLARRSALTATLIARLVPARGRRLRPARRGGRASRPGRRAGRPGGRWRGGCVAGSLDRAVDVAATLELRGYAHGRPRSARRRSPLPPRRAASSAAGIAHRRRSALAARDRRRSGSFDPYPTVASTSDADAGDRCALRGAAARRLVGGARRSRVARALEEDPC